MEKRVENITKIRTFKNNHVRYGVLERNLLVFRNCIRD